MGITEENKICDESRGKIYIQNSCSHTRHKTVIFTKCLLLFFPVAVIVSHNFEKSKCGITKEKLFFPILLNGCGLWSSTFRKQQIPICLELGLNGIKNVFLLATSFCYTMILRFNNVDTSVE